MLILESENGIGSGDIGSIEYSDSEELSGLVYGRGKWLIKKGNFIY